MSVLILAWLLVSCAGRGRTRPDDGPADGLGDGARPRAELTDLVTHLTDDGSLIAGLSHGDPALRLIAARGLARLPVPTQLRDVLARLGVENNPQVLAEECFALGRWGATEAGTRLRELAHHPSSAVRAAALAALGRLRDDEQTNLVVGALDDSNAAVRRAAALALADLDGRRFDHPRKAGKAVRERRDRALALTLAEDPDPEVRWRAAYALASVRPLADQVAPLQEALAEQDQDPVVQAFALRGLGALQEAGFTDATPTARRFLDHDDLRVVIEAVQVLGDHGGYREVGLLALSHESAVVRSVAWGALPGARARERVRRADDSGAPHWPADLVQLDQSLRDQIAREPEQAVRREALAALAGFDDALAQALGESWREAVPEGSRVPQIERRRTGLSARAVEQLAHSDDPRDRARAGELMVADVARDGDLIITLLDDPDARVRAALLPLLADDDYASLNPRLAEALRSGDPALMGQAATAAKPLVAAGRAPPWLIDGLAQALEGCQDFVMAETRIELAKALSLPPLDPLPPPPSGDLSLLQLLVQRQQEALADPAPMVALQTERGTVTLRLDRTLAPVHVASFLELAESGFYDGLDFHRVVANFVVQGLDPRGDGWGVGGRRVPDEPSPQPFLGGSLGMPAASQPQTGGCQIFITLLPAPHLDGNYTIFGQVVDGMDVVQSLLVGDKVLSVRRINEG